jgi:uncharacterized surface anchored protein
VALTAWQHYDPVVKKKTEMWDLKQKINLSKVQTIVGLTAGILSITFSLSAFFKKTTNTSTKGELVAIVKDSKTEMAVSDAMIEVLTSENAVISTLKPDWSGKARVKLEEGRYRVRVTHPKYRSEIREVQLVSKESTEVRLQLRSTTAIDGVKRLFRH